MRAIAALSVAIFHFTNHYNGQNFLIKSEKVREGFVVGAQGVEIFYLISGFIIPFALYHSGYRIRNYFQYMGKRLVRLMPPYIATIILINIVGYCLCRFLWGCVHEIDFGQLFVNVFFLADLFPQYDWINPIFATLEVELQFYLLIGLLFPIFLKKDWALPGIVAALLIGGILTLDSDTVLRNSPYFMLGLTAFFIREQGWKLPFIISLAASLGVLFHYYLWEDLGAAVLGTLLVIFLPTGFKVLSFTGKISYSYYLVHGLAGGWFLFFISSRSFGQDHPVMAIIAALCLSWVAAFILYYIFEKPALKLVKRIKYNTKKGEQ